MRLLPDKNFKENYKKRYDANYEKIMNYRREREEAKAERPPFDLARFKKTLAGAAAVIAIFGSVLGMGAFFSSVFDEQENEITKLEREIAGVENTIREYQVINSEEKYVQINEALFHVTSLQNQYASNEFNADFEVYAERYLGNYNNNWAGELEKCENPVWKGYLDNSCEFRDSADMLFILYDNLKPVIVAKVSFGLTESGNLDVMKSVQKQRLT